MSKIWILAIIFIVITSVFLEDVPIQRNDDSRLYRGQSHFVVAMMKSLKKIYPRKNLFFSPHSIYRTLLRAYIGSGGEIKDSLKEVLFLDWIQHENDIDNAYKAEKIARAKRFTGEKIHFNSSDKFYVTKNAMLNPRMKDVFTFTEIDRVDFSNPEACRSDINAFVKKLTDGNINATLPIGAIQNQQNIFLVNSAFFEGLFKRPFHPLQTKYANFNGAQDEFVEMMYVYGDFEYGVLKKENAAVLKVPYEGENDAISMYVYLPFEKSSSAVDDLMDKLSAETIKDALTMEMDTQRVDFHFPKMSLNGEYLLKDVLEDMGIRKLFDYKLFKNIIHKTGTTINENGASAWTVGSTVNSLGLSKRCEFARSEIVPFHCDRPFVYTINDQISQDVLFAGVFREPEIVFADEK